MPYVVKRGNRFTGYYRKNGKRVSAGTYANEQEALSYATIAQKTGTVNVSHRAVTVDKYFTKWIARVDLMPITKKNYELTYRTYVRDHLGHYALDQVTLPIVRSLILELLSEGIKPSTLSKVKACIGSMYKSVLEENPSMGANPTHGITVKANQPDLKNVLEPEDFKRIVSNLPTGMTGGAKLLATFLVVSGCRFGEATELRVKDFNFDTGEVYVQRRVSELGTAYGKGTRFKVIEGTKSGKKRSVSLSKALLQEIKAYVSTNDMRKEDLLFPRGITLTAGKLESSRGTESPLESFSRDGKQFQHGTLYAYNHGGCRCEDCKAVRRKPSRAERAMNDETSHLPRGVWRNTWNKAIAKSGIGWTPRTHDLRHANATQLLKNGVDVHEVKERLGHQSINTTERYLHRLRHQQSKAGELANDFME